MNNFNDLIDLEMLMNLMNFLIDTSTEKAKFKQKGYKEAVSTLLYHFYSNELLSEKFCLGYLDYAKNKNNKLDRAIKEHWLYNKKVEHLFRRGSKEFRSWFKKAEVVKEETKVEE